MEVLARPLQASPASEGRFLTLQPSAVMGQCTRSRVLISSTFPFHQHTLYALPFSTTPCCPCAPARGLAE
jgi:hypothetical protein